MTESVEQHIALGVEAQEAGNWKAAFHHFRQAAQLDPTCALVCRLAGDALGRLGEWKAAVESYGQAIRLDPCYADAYNNLGIALVEVGRDKDAIAAYAKAIEVKPDHANAYFNLGKLSARFDELPTAIGLFQKAIAIQPLHAYAYHELGSAQEKSGLLEAAAASYAKSVELDPTRTVRENLAAALTLIGDPRGIDQLEQLVHEPPLSAESHWNLGMGLLLHRRYAEGWKEYEWRTEIPRFYRHHHRFDQPKWRGEALAGKTILLYGEQGYGDTLQFLRYVPLVVKRGGRVLLEVRPLMRSLLQTLPGVAECVSLDQPSPAFSTHAPLMSLPYLLGEESIPAPVSPVVPVGSKQDSLPYAQLKVGIAWAGNSSQKRDRLRSIPLVQWKALANIQGADFTALQMGPATRDREESKVCFHFVSDCCDLPDFAALAAVVSKLDLVITVDTAVAHLAGNMGKAVWILLPNAVDWRWGLYGEATDWYPSARLFRQTAPADWSGVMARVHQELQRLIDHAQTAERIL